MGLRSNSSHTVRYAWDRTKHKHHHTRVALQRFLFSIAMCDFADAILGCKAGTFGHYIYIYISARRKDTQTGNLRMIQMICHIQSTLKQYVMRRQIWPVAHFDLCQKAWGDVRPQELALQLAGWQLHVLTEIRDATQAAAKHGCVLF